VQPYYNGRLNVTATDIGASTRGNYGY